MPQDSSNETWFVDSIVPETMPKRDLKELDITAKTGPSVTRATQMLNDGQVSAPIPHRAIVFSARSNQYFLLSNKEKMNPRKSCLCQGFVDHIPVCWIEPRHEASSPIRSSAPKIAIILPAVTGWKEQMATFLLQLARDGFIAISLDPYGHGSRSGESTEALMARIFGNFRREMWPILGNTTLDTVRVIDWAIDRFAANFRSKNRLSDDLCTENEAVRVYVGGFSMGGDVAIAVAGLDPRVTCAGAIVSSPDWTRPGMKGTRGPATVLEQGSPDPYATFFYKTLDPTSNIEKFLSAEHAPALTFQLGEDDQHIPAQHALDFAKKLTSSSGSKYASDPDRIQVVVHKGVGHHADNPVLWAGVRRWFLSH